MSVVVSRGFVSLPPTERQLALTFKLFIKTGRAFRGKTREEASEFIRNEIGTSYSDFDHEFDGDEECPDHFVEDLWLGGS